jgi:hypothetical protein
MKRTIRAIRQAKGGIAFCRSPEAEKESQRCRIQFGRSQPEFSKPKPIVTHRLTWLTASEKFTNSYSMANVAMAKRIVTFMTTASFIILVINAYAFTGSRSRSRNYQGRKTSGTWQRNVNQI